MKDKQKKLSVYLTDLPQNLRRRPGQSKAAPEAGHLGPEVASVSKWTNQRGPERLLRDSHFWYAGDTIIINDEEGRIIDCNAQASESLGYNRQELMNLSIPDIAIMSEERRDKPLWKKIGPGETTTIESACKRKDGTTFPVEICIRHLPRPERTLFVAIVRDITRRKKAEEEVRGLLFEVQQDKDRLLKLQEEMRTIFDILPVGVTVIDDKWNILNRNQSIERIVGMNREDMIMTKYKNRRYIRGDGTPMPVEEMPSMISIKEQRTVEGVEIGIVGEDGPDIWVSVSAAPLPGRGALVVTSDITRRKQDREMLKQHVEEIEDTNKALRILLKQREHDKKEFEETVVSNIKRLIMPHIEYLRGSAKRSEDAAHLEIIESALEYIMSTFSMDFSRKLGNLSPKEIQISNLIKEGMQDKDIAELLNLSPPTIRAHRRNIRKKLGLTGQKINLRSFLSQAERN